MNQPGAPALTAAESGPRGPDSDTVGRTRSRRQVVITMGGLLLAVFLASLDQTVVGTAIPRIVTDLGGFDRFTWITTSYIVASITFVPIVGRLSDLYGRKAFFIGGILLFLVGSVLAGASQTMNQLIAARAVQGVGGGAMMALAFTTVADLFAPRERGKYTGYVAAVYGFSSMIGPVLGGLITDNLSWHWIFYVNVPLGSAVIFLFIRFFPNVKPAKRKHRLDYPGMALLIAAVVSLLVGLSLAGVEYAWSSPQIIGTLLFAAVTAIAFIVVEWRSADPIMPLSIYSDRIVSISLAVTFLTGFAMFGTIIFIPLFFQAVLGTSATSSGSFLTPMMLSMVLAAALSGQALSRFGGHYRIQGLIGFAIFLVGLVFTSQMTPDTSFLEAVAFITVLGFGVGITYPCFSISVQNAVPAQLLGAATSATQFFRQIGGALGLAVLGSYMTARFHSRALEALSAEVRSAFPSRQLDDLAENPQALVNPEALDRLRASISGQDEQLLAQLLESLRSVLSSSISEVFLVVTVAVVIAFAMVIFLPESPLSDRRPHQADQPQKTA
ncbi:MAG: MDR family MFS transporter [Chloroflexota bacterium]|nr:MDR family MFS transporter [Chloroflexota bacterium]